MNRKLLFFIVLIFLIGIGVFVSFSFKAIHKKIVNLGISILKLKDILIVEELRDNLQNTLETAKNNLLFLSNLTSLKKLITATNPEDKEVLLKDLREDFLVFSQTHKEFFQIRYLDENGKEVVRINREGDSFYIVPSEELQDKNHQYCFIESIAFSPGQIYVSNLDLNMEEGKLEQPYRPTLRLATPLFTPKGTLKGIVAVNIEMKDFLSKLEEYNLWLVNEKGIFFAAPQPKLLYQKSDIKFSPSAEEVSKGIFFNPGASPFLYTYIDIGKRRWLVGKFFDVKKITPLIHTYQSDTYRLLIGFAIFILLMVFIMFGWYHRIKEKENIEREMRLAEIGRLVSTIYHDIANPLMVIMNMPQLIKENLKECLKRDLSLEEKMKILERVQKDLDEIAKAASRQEKLIGEIKDTVRGRFKPLFKEVDLETFFSGVLESWKKYVEDIKLELNYKGKLTLDRDRFERVFFNLIRNAGEASGGKASVTITSSQEDDYIKFTVSDNGPGIPKRIQKTLFKLGATYGKKEGTGLGLYIVKKTVELYRGKITCRSYPGEGTTFTIKIPKRISNKKFI